MRLAKWSLKAYSHFVDHSGGSDVHQRVYHCMRMRDTWEESAMRGIGTYVHAGMKHITLDEYEELASDSRWANLGYCISVGFAVDNDFLKMPGEVRWEDVGSPLVAPFT